MTTEEILDYVSGHPSGKVKIAFTDIDGILRGKYVHIDKFKSATEARNVGTVVSVTDGIVRIHGLADARYGEMLEFAGNIFGLALNLEQDSVGAVVLGDYKHIVEGDIRRLKHGSHPNRLAVTKQFLI